VPSRSQLADGKGERERRGGETKLGGVRRNVDLGTADGCRAPMHVLERQGEKRKKRKGGGGGGVTEAE